MDGPAQAPAQTDVSALPESVSTATRTAFTTHVVLSAYNEAGSLPPLLDRLGELADGWGDPMKVWVVDDGSSDGTADIARRGDERVASRSCPTR